MVGSSPLDLPVLISQLHHVQKIANAELVKSDIQKELFAPVIAEHLRKKGKEQVQGIDKREKTEAVDRDGSNKQEQQLQQQKERDKKAPSEEETSPSTDSPWAGNIINVKI